LATAEATLLQTMRVFVGEDEMIMKEIEKYTFGVGDRFAQEGEAQLQAIVQAEKLGIKVVPVWNKSNREHKFIKSEPQSVRDEAESAVAALGWRGGYHVDADHIGLNSVDGFILASDFFTLDVADFTGQPASRAEIDRFVVELGRYRGPLVIPGIDTAFEITDDLLRQTAFKFLLATQQAGRIYRHIRERKREDFITEVSIDETDTPQTPVELFLILAMIARESIPAQTVAPKFTGRFNKGVDYFGQMDQFETEFDEDLAVIAFAIREFGLPSTLKLSVHSGSDKFSLYPIMNRLVKEQGAGLHLKTCGTTWLEEIVGLAEAGEEGLRIAKEIYAAARARFDEMVNPYSTVVDIDPARLPSEAEVAGWEPGDFAAALRHDQSCKAYNPHFRQYLHISFKVAAEMGDRYRAALKEHATVISRNVTFNLLNRHIIPLFQ
jgi:tagaturonate epimerase